MDTEDLIVCRVCGQKKRELNGHLRMHKMSSAEYQDAFSGAPLISAKSSALKSSGVSRNRKEKPRVITAETRAKLGAASKAAHARLKDDPNYIERQQRTAAAARAAKGDDYRHSAETLEKMRGPRENQRGVTLSAEHRAKISAARSGMVIGPHKPETIKKMKEAWKTRKADTETYAAYVASVSERMKQPEMQAGVRARTAELIKNGGHNGKSKDTKLEIRMKEFLSEHEEAYEHQFILRGDFGAFTFDFHLPRLNMLVEVDGEYWHRKSKEQINRDQLKERKALAAGYRFVRISDADWEPGIVYASPTMIEAHNAKIMRDRQ